MYYKTGNRVYSTLALRLGYNKWTALDVYMEYGCVSILEGIIQCLSVERLSCSKEKVVHCKPLVMSSWQTDFIGKLGKSKNKR